MGFIEKWKNGESAIGRWLAETATGTIVKAGITPLLIWVGQTVSESELNPAVAVVIIAVVPAAINLLNPSDKRGGIVAPDPAPPEE